MGDISQNVVSESRRNIDEWAAESRMLMAAEPGTRWSAEEIADLIAALGHPGAGRALADAGYVIAQFTDWLSRRDGQELDAAETAALLGMAGLVLAEREAHRG